MQKQQKQLRGSKQQAPFDRFHISKKMDLDFGQPEVAG